MQDPVTIELGTSYKYRRRGHRRLLVEQKDTFQYIPLIENLQSILQNKEIYIQVICNKLLVLSV